LYDEVDVAPVVVGTYLDVLVLIDRVKILCLIKPRERDLEVILVVDVALVKQELAPHHLVACERVACEFEPAKLVLLTFVDRYLDIDDTLIRVRRIVPELRIELGRVLN